MCTGAKWAGGIHVGMHESLDAAVVQTVVLKVYV